MAGLWVSDREPAVRELLAEVLPEGEILSPAELETRLTAHSRPEALMIDGTQLLELPTRLRRAVLGLPHVLICTGVSLAALPTGLMASPTVAILAKPFSVEDLEAAADWLRGSRVARPSAVPG